MQEQEFISPEYVGPERKERLEETPFEPSPNNPPWNVWVAIGVWVASVVFILIIPNLFLFPYLFSQPIDFSNKETLIEFAKTDPTAVLLQLVGIVPAHLFTLVLAWLVATKLRRYSFRETLGFEWDGFRIWHGIVLFLLFWGFAILMTQIFGPVDNDFEKLIRSSRAAVYLVAFFATFTAPLVEEVIYRGLLYSALQRKFGIVLAVISVTLLFTLVHVPQYSLENVPDYATILTLLMLSLTLTLIRVKTKNLLPCIVLHTMVNGIQSVVLIAEPYLPKTLTDTQEATSMIWHIF